MTTLPRNIQAQVEAADAYLAQADQALNSAPAQTLEDMAQSAPPAPETAPPVNVLLQAQASPEPLTPAPTPTENVWEQKYKTLQGLFNREMPVLQSQVKSLAAENQQLNFKLKDTDRARQDDEPTAPAANPQDVDLFGADLVEMVNRVAQSVLGSTAQKVSTAVAAFDQRLQQLEHAAQGTAQSIAVSAEQAFFDRLTKLVPQWEEVNANPAFLSWLGDTDPVYGTARQTALDAAQRAMNPDRAAQVFLAFAPPSPAAAKPNALEKQASPRATAGTAPTGNDKPMVTQKQITDFYADMSRNKYRGRQAEAEQMEKVINLAIAEGRVR